MTLTASNDDECHASSLPAEMTRERRDERSRRRAKRYRRDLQALARFEYGSATPGQPGWTQRWYEREGRRVLMFATRDYAGSFSRLAEAVNQETGFAVRCVIGRPHQYGYEHDLVIPGSLMTQSEGLERLLRSRRRSCQGRGGVLRRLK